MLVAAGWDPPPPPYPPVACQGHSFLDWQANDQQVSAVTLFCHCVRQRFSAERFGHRRCVKHPVLCSAMCMRRPFVLIV